MAGRSPGWGLWIVKDVLVWESSVLSPRCRFQVYHLPLTTEPFLSQQSLQSVLDQPDHDRKDERSDDPAQGSRLPGPGRDAAHDRLLNLQAAQRLVEIVHRRQSLLVHPTVKKRPSMRPMGCERRAGAVPNQA